MQKPLTAMIKASSEATPFSVLPLGVYVALSCCYGIVMLMLSPKPALTEGPGLPCLCPEQS